MNYHLAWALETAFKGLSDTFHPFVYTHPKPTITLWESLKNNRETFSLAWHRMRGVFQ